MKMQTSLPVCILYANSRLSGSFVRHRRGEPAARKTFPFGEGGKNLRFLTEEEITPPSS